jgi:hypothetical protein
MILTRRKFFSFFGTGVVMAVAPQIIPATVEGLAHLAPGYGHGIAEALMFMRYLDEQTRLIVFGEVQSHADRIFHGFKLKGDR